MKLATLCYVQRAGRTLMVHRVKKQNDMHKGKWNGLGGKLEPGESPEECAIREVWEESGLTCRNPRLRGLITFPAYDEIDDWYTFLFTLDDFEGDLIDSPEGDLDWVDDDKLLSLNLWPGDRVFLPWIFEDPFFSAKFVYDRGVFQWYEATFYDAGGGMRYERQCHQPSVDGASSPTFTPVYTPADDVNCWVCGAPTEKRHCKITCLTCGFMRDCSDP